MQGSVIGIIVTAISSFFGMFAMAAFFEGYLFKLLTIFERSLLLVSCVLLIYPGIKTDIIGYIILGGMILLQKKFKKVTKESLAQVI